MTFYEIHPESLRGETSIVQKTIPLLQKKLLNNEKISRTQNGIR